MSARWSGWCWRSGVAFVQFWPDWPWVVAVACVFFFGQFIEGNILQPRLVGKSVGLHPVWLMFALFAFSALFGFVGLLIAVPAAAAVAVLVRFAIGPLSAVAALPGRRPATSPARSRPRAAAERRTPERRCPTPERPRQLPLDLGHAAGTFARRPGRVCRQRRGRRADRALAGLAGAGRGACRAGGLAASRISAPSGAAAGAAVLDRAVRLGAEAIAAAARGSGLHRRRGRGGPRRRRAVPSDQRGAGGRDVDAADRAAASRRAWGVALPDLASRLKAAATVEIGEPDDLLLAGVIAKLFADRQVEVEPHVVHFLVRRMERSLSTAITRRRPRSTAPRCKPRAGSAGLWHSPCCRRWKRAAPASPIPTEPPAELTRRRRFRLAVAGRAPRHERLGHRTGPARRAPRRGHG